MVESSGLDAGRPPRRPLRVGISCYPTYGGSGVLACELALRLVDRGHRVYVFSYDLPARLRGMELGDPSHPGPGLFFRQVEVRPYPLFEYPPYSLALANEMVQVARRGELDLLHAHYAVPNAVSALLAQQIVHPLPLPVVTTLHGTDVTLVGNDPSYLETTRWSVEQSNAVTAVSRWLEQATRDQLGSSERPLERDVEVIPNFVEASRFASCRAALGEQPLLVHVSNYRRVKRTRLVVETFAALRQKRPCRLRMVGEGPERTAAEDRARELGIDEAVEWIGNGPAIETALDGCALFVLTSELESFGLAALEAMAAGLPVLSTRVGGVPEVIEDGVVGRLVAEADPEVLAAAAQDVLGDEERWATWGAAAREIAGSRFGCDTVVDQYESLYVRLTGADAEAR